MKTPEEGEKMLIKRWTIHKITFGIERNNIFTTREEDGQWKKNAIYFSTWYTFSFSLRLLFHMLVYDCRIPNPRRWIDSHPMQTPKKNGAPSTYYHIVPSPPFCIFFHPIFQPLLSSVAVATEISFPSWQIPCPGLALLHTVRHRVYRLTALQW